MLVQHYLIIGSSSRICWQVTMCARVDTDKEKQDKDKENIILLLMKSTDTDHLSCLSFGIFLNRNILLHTTVTADTPDLSDSVTELAYSMLKSFTPHMSITIEEENILVYISGNNCRKVSWSACDQCKVNLMPIINCLHFCLRSNI